MEEHFSRHSFCVSLVAAAGAVMTRMGPAVADDTATWTPLGPATKFTRQTVTPVTLPKSVGGDHAFVVHGDGDGLTVFSAHCTHKGCPLSWDKGTSLFACPCHGGKFDITGKVVAGPPPTPLKTIPSKVTADGQLCIKTA